MVRRFLNLGCGNDYRVGWDNWDISKDCKSDLVIDIAKESWPIRSKHYDQIYCSGVLEQILKNDELLHIMNESWGCLKDNGAMTIIVPSAKYSVAFQDPHDVRFFTEGTFKYFCHGTHEYKMFGKVYGYKPWKIQSIHTHPDNGIITVILQKYVS